MDLFNFMVTIGEDSKQVFLVLTDLLGEEVKSGQVPSTLFWEDMVEQRDLEVLASVVGQLWGVRLHSAELGFRERQGGLSFQVVMV